MSTTSLHKIALMNFEQLSTFVQKATNGEKYIAKPGEASEIDCDVCSEAIINIVVMPAIKNEHKRADARSLKVGLEDAKTAELIASAALTYWVNHGFIVAQNARINRAISAKIKEEEIAHAKADMIALQMGTIGAILGARSIRKSNMIQGFWDFEESDLQIARINNESEMPASYHTLEVIG